MPLALELAAARLRVMTPTQLLARLDHRLALLGTLRAALDEAWDQLTPPERTALGCLSVFEAPCSIEAAENKSKL